MPGRNYVSSSGGYRYGMNGQEKDNEIAGNGNIYTAEYWEYDSRIGRRWEQDPLAYEDQSPYATFNNNPLVYSDPTGLVGEDEITKVWNNKTGQYDEKSRTDRFGKGTDLTHYEGGDKDGQHVVTSERGTWTYGERNGNKYGDLNSHRQWQAYSGYHSNETRTDRMFRLMGNAHLEEMRDFGGGGYNMFGGYGKASQAVKELASLESRAKDIHSALKPFTQQKTTTAVADVLNSEGKAVRWVASSEPRLRPAQRAAMRAGEVEIKGQGHAEQTIMNHAARTGGTVLKVAASRPICPTCATSILNGGAAPASALKSVSTFNAGR